MTTVEQAPQQEAEAEALRERAKAHFSDGEYRKALPFVERAYALTQSPRDLFNLGVLHHKLSECIPARDSFERYLEQDPSSSVRSNVLVALEELRAQCPAQDSARVPPAATIPDEPVVALAPLAPPRRRLEPELERRWAPGATPLILLGLGAAAGAGALISLAAQERAQRDIDGLGATAEREGRPWDSLEGQRRDLSSNARLYHGLSLGLGAACVALVGAGATAWIVETGNGSSLRTAAAGIGYRGRF